MLPDRVRAPARRGGAPRPDLHRRAPVPPAERAPRPGRPPTGPPSRTSRAHPRGAPGRGTGSRPGSWPPDRTCRAGAHGARARGLPRSGPTSAPAPPDPATPPGSTVRRPAPGRRAPAPQGRAGHAPVSRASNTRRSVSGRASQASAFVANGRDSARSPSSPQIPPKPASPGFEQPSRPSPGSETRQGPSGSTSNSTTTGSSGSSATGRAPTCSPPDHASPCRHLSRRPGPPPEGGHPPARRAWRRGERRRSGRPSPPAETRPPSSGWPREARTRPVRRGCDPPPAGTARAAVPPGTRRTAHPCR